MTHHRVKLMQGIADLLHIFSRHHHLYCQVVNITLVCRHELMKRRIQETDGHRPSFHHLIQCLEVPFLERDQCIQCFFSLLYSSCQNHLTNLRNPVRFEEHMLGTAKTDTFCAIFDRIGCVGRRICIGAYFQLTIFVRPLHNATEITAYRRFHCLDITLIDLTGGAIQRNIISLMELFSAQFKYLVLFIDCNVAASGYTCRPHTACHHCCVGCHTAAHSEDTFCRMHTFDVFRRRLQTNKNNSFALFVSCLRLFCGKIYFTCRCTGRRR